ncbi:MAG: hypothetical protein ACEQSA_04180 [Weeksellaceae bacterium]
MNNLAIKKQFVIGLLVFLLIVLAIIVMILRSRISTTGTTPDGNTPTTVPITAVPANAPLEIVSFQSDAATGTLLPNSIIEVSLNRAFVSNEVQIGISPDIQTNQTIEGTAIYISPQTNWTIGTAYTFSVTAGGQTTDYELRTVETQTAGSQGVNTRPEGAYEESLAFQLQNHPDSFLTNQTPFATDRFSIISQYIEQPTGHFAFAVTLNGDEAEARTYFRVWLESLGLSATQIDELDITYQTSP